jgi:hypothetical protein
VGNRGASSAGTPAGTGADGLIIINYTPAAATRVPDFMAFFS